MSLRIDVEIALSSLGPGIEPEEHAKRLREEIWAAYDWSRVEVTLKPDTLRPILVMSADGDELTHEHQDAIRALMDRVHNDL